MTYSKKVISLICDAAGDETDPDQKNDKVIVDGIAEVKNEDNLEDTIPSRPRKPEQMN